MPIPISRNEKQNRIDTWLLDHREFVERETPTVIARELKRLGYYSERTALVDIRVGVYRRCLRLDLHPVKAPRHPTPAPAAHPANTSSVPSAPSEQPAQPAPSDQSAP